MLTSLYRLRPTTVEGTVVGRVHARPESLGPGSDSGRTLGPFREYNNGHFTLVIILNDPTVPYPL